MTRSPLAALALWPLALAASPASTNWISGGELVRHCRAYLGDAQSRQGTACVAFVQGYLSVPGGLYAGKLKHVANGDGFAERAARTRVGSRLRSLDEQQAERRPYCLDDPPAAAVVVRAVAEHLSAHARSPETAPDRLVHQALVERFPCSDD